jgi:hypothetical protein
MCLSLTTASGPRQRSYSQVRVFYFLGFETPLTWRARSPYLYPPATGWPSYTPRALDSLFVASYDPRGCGEGIRTRLYTASLTNVKVKVKVTLRLTVGQSVSLGIEPCLGLITRYLFLFESYGLVFCGAPSLTRGQVCLLYMLLALASALFLGSV